MKNLELTYQEKVTTKEIVSVADLKDRFKPIKSVDIRYDGMNELIFNLEHKSELYKKFLRKPVYYKANKFTGQHAIFYKICNEKQINHFTEILDKQHIDYIDGVNKRAVGGLGKKYIKPYSNPKC